MKTHILIKTVFLPCIAIIIAITVGCKSDSTQPAQTEAEKDISAKLSANVWHGVWYVDSIGDPYASRHERYYLPIFCEEITFAPNKSCAMKSCDNITSKDWSIVESNGSAILSIADEQYVVEKLNTDTLIIRGQSVNSQPYLFLRNFKGYNRIKGQHTLPNRDTLGYLGLECAPMTEVTRRLFGGKFNVSHQNPVSTSTPFRIYLNTFTKGTKVKMTLDDGETDPITIIDTTYTAESNYCDFNLKSKKYGVYRITYTVKTPDATETQTGISYLFVGK